MAVELAVLMPVIIVVGLVVFNLARFVSLCASFDRISLDAVISQGVSSSGNATDWVRVDAVEESIGQALDAADVCWVEVKAEPEDARSQVSALSLAPRFVRVTCTLVFRPWPSTFVMAGVPYDVPIVLRHERSLVVDRSGFGVV